MEIEGLTNSYENIARMDVNFNMVKSFSEVILFEIDEFVGFNRYAVMLREKIKRERAKEED